MNAVRAARELLRALLNSKETPRIPKYVREWTYRCLKHYPQDFYLKDIFNANHRDNK